MNRLPKVLIVITVVLLFTAVTACSFSNGTSRKSHTNSGLVSLKARLNKPAAPLLPTAPSASNILKHPAGTTSATANNTSTSASSKPSTSNGSAHGKSVVGKVVPNKHTYRIKFTTRARALLAYYLPVSRFAVSRVGLVAPVDNADVSRLSKLEQLALHGKFIEVNGALSSVYYVDTVDTASTAAEYKAKYFSHYSTIGRMAFTYSGKFSPNDFRMVALVKKANIVILKKHRASNTLTYYDVLFLAQNVEDPASLPVNNNISAALPLDPKHSLDSEIAKPNVHLSYVLYKGAPAASDNSGSKRSLLTIPASLFSVLPKNSAFTPLYDISGSKGIMGIYLNPKIMANFNPNAIITDEDKMSNRMNHLEGLWVDKYDHTVIAIRRANLNYGLHSTSRPLTALPAKTTDQINYVGYVVANAKTVNSLNSSNKLNPGLSWHSGDIKLSFTVDKLAHKDRNFYVDSNKMLAPAEINVYPARGYIAVIRLDNGEERYLLPLNSKVSASYIRNLYKYLPDRIAPFDERAQAPGFTVPVSNALSVVLIEMLLGFVSLL